MTSNMISAIITMIENGAKGQDLVNGEGFHYGVLGQSIADESAFRAQHGVGFDQAARRIARSEGYEPSDLRVSMVEALDFFPFNMGTAVADEDQKQVCADAVAAKARHAGVMPAAAFCVEYAYMLPRAAKRNARIAIREHAEAQDAVIYSVVLADGTSFSHYLLGNGESWIEAEADGSNARHQLPHRMMRLLTNPAEGDIAAMDQAEAAADALLARQGHTRTAEKAAERRVRDARKAARKASKKARGNRR